MGIIGTCVFACLAFGPPQAAPVAQPPVVREPVGALLLLDARVHVPALRDEAAPTAVAIRGARIVAIGSAAECRAALAAGAPDGSDIVEEIDLAGATLLRGFFDGHAHLQAGALDRAALDLRGCASEAEMLARVQAHIARMKVPGAWILGRGFDQSLWPRREWPTRRPLDQVTEGWPALLERVDGHSALANTAALAIAGIDETTPDPPGGVIVRDREGVPTGVLKEAAVDLVARRVPSPTLQARIDATIRILEEAARLGVTSITDHGGDPAAYEVLLARGMLSARIDVWGNLGDDLDAAAAMRERLEPVRQWIRFATLKGFVDGTFGSRTAALFEPYADDRSTSGLVVVDARELADRVAAADARGFQVALHAIGDRAVSIALDAFAEARRRNGGTGPRHRIEHVQVVRRADLARMAALGVTASIQPCHLLTDRRFAQDRLGPKRALDSYPWRSLLEAGVPLAIGTDFPVEPLDPRRNLFAAIARADEKDAAAPAYVPGEALSLADALHAMTAGAARAAHREDELGDLRSGTLADLVALAGPLDAADPRALLSLEVVLTVSGGRVAFRR